MIASDDIVLHFGVLGWKSSWGKGSGLYELHYRIWIQITRSFEFLRSRHTWRCLSLVSLAGRIPYISNMDDVS